MHPPRKILALKLRALGDTVLLSAPLLALHRAYPMAELTCLVSARWAPLLEHHPAIHRLLTYDRPESKTARTRSLARLSFYLRKLRPDVTLTFNASPSSALLSFASGAPVRANHFHDTKTGNRYSTVEIPDKGAPKTLLERDFDVLRAIGIVAPTADAPIAPQVFLTATEHKLATETLRARFALQGPILSIGLGTGDSNNLWPIARFAQVALRWAQENRGSVLALVDPGEPELAREWMRTLEQELTRTASLTNPADRARVRAQIQVHNQFNVREFAAALAQSSVFLSDHSGSKILASAVGTPRVVALLDNKTAATQNTPLTLIGTDAVFGACIA